MAESLRQKTFSGMLWSLAERFSIQAFGFVQGVILARLLMPSDYGLIAMTGIFFAVSYCLIDSGFTTALIRKKDKTEIDYSTVYVINMSLSFFFACLLCLCSSLIADFYNEPILRDIVCANALLMFCGSFTAVQGTRLLINLQFKTRSTIGVTSTIVTGLATIAMAYMGFGVWSLVWPNFVTLLIKGVMYWHYQHWFPGFAFSRKSAKDMFSFGSKYLATSVINMIFANLSPLIIGKVYSAKDLGYYQKGNDYSAMVATTLTNVLGMVTFPILSKMQDDDATLARAYRQMIRQTAFFVFPMLIGLAVLGKPFVIVLLTEKWQEAIIYLQIVCLGAMWGPINTLNLNLLQVKGRSDLFLKIEVFKKIISVVTLCVTVPLGIIYMCIGGVVNALIYLVVNTYYTGKLIHVGFFVQMGDLFPIFFKSMLMGAIVWLCTRYIPSLPVQLAVGIVLGILAYYLICRLTKSPELAFMENLLKERFAKK